MLRDNYKNSKQDIKKFPTFASQIVFQTVNNIKIIKITIQIYVCKQHNFLI